MSYLLFLWVLKRLERWDVDWDWLYGGLDDGEYRIIKGISTNTEKHTLAAEFESHNNNK